MYVIVVGAGKVGYHLTRTLVAEGHEVALIEKNPATVARLAAEFGEAIVVGDGCEVRVMQDVGMGRADCVVAVTGHDEDNLVICQMAQRHFHVPRQIAQERFHVPKVLARVYDPIRAQAYREEAGMNTVCTTTINAGLLHDLLLDSPLRTIQEYLDTTSTRPPRKAGS